jgi:hypothetical protein
LDYLLTFDWATIAKTGFSALVGAGLGSALIQGWFNSRAERRKREGQATYLAMRLAVLLDAFGEACGDMISNNANPEEYPAEGLPTLPAYPEDTEGWVSLDRDLGMRCLQLPSDLRQIKGHLDAMIRFTHDEPDDPDPQDTLNQEAAKVGLKAWQLSKDLQRRYDLSDAGADYASWLKEQQARASKALQERHEMRVRSMLELHGRSGAPDHVAGDRHGRVGSNEPRDNIG